MQIINNNVKHSQAPLLLMW